MDGSSKTEELARDVRQGDRRAFDALATRHRAALAGYVGVRVGDHLRGRVEVEDVVQIALMQAFECIDRFRWTGEGSFRRWLQGIAEHAILKLARTERRRPLLYVEVERPAGDDSPSRSRRREERFRRLEEALKGLKDDYREVILLARIEGLPVAEIARRMGRSPNAVVHLLSRALAGLKEAFGDTESLHLPPRSLQHEGSSDDDG